MNNVSNEKTDERMLEANFLEVVSKFCAVRNAVVKKTDLLRELRADAEDHFVGLKSNTDSLKNLSEIVRDIQVSLDDAHFSLEKYQYTLLDSVDLISKMSVLHNEAKSGSIEKRESLDFNQRKNLELLENRYHKTIENFEKMKDLLSKILSKEPAKPAKLDETNEQELNAREQKVVADTTKNIANMVIRLSVRVTFLQKQLCQLKSVSSVHNQELKPQNIKKILELEEARQLNDQCVMPINRLLLISEETRAEARVLWRALGLDRNVEHDLKMQLNLLDYFSKRDPIGKKIMPKMVLTGTSDALTKKLNSTPKISAKDELILEKLSLSSAQKPRMVSVATQSPNFVAEQQRPLREISLNKKSVAVPVSGVIVSTDVVNSKLSSTPKTITSTAYTQTPIVVKSVITEFQASAAENSTNSTESFVTPTEKPLPPVTSSANLSLLNMETPKAGKIASYIQDKPSVSVQLPIVSTSVPVQSSAAAEHQQPTISQPQITTSATPQVSTQLAAPIVTSNSVTYTKASVVTTTANAVIKEDVPATAVSFSFNSANAVSSTISPTSTIEPTSTVSSTTSILSTLPKTATASLQFSFKPTTSTSDDLSSSTPATTFPVCSNASPTAISFSFKPPTTAAMPTAVSTVATTTATTTGNEEGMEDDSGASSVNGVNFNFNKTGLGSAFGGTSNSSAPKNPFGGAFEKQSNTQNSLFSDNSKTNQANPLFTNKSSAFGGGGGNTSNSGNAFGGGAFGGGNTSNSGSAFGGSAFGGGNTSNSGSAFGGGNTSNSGSAFGGSAFGGATSGGTVFGGSAFGKNPNSPFAAKNTSPMGQSAFGSTPFSPSTSGSAFNGAFPGSSTPQSSGFSAFANKSSGFGQLAATSQQKPSLFSGEANSSSAFSSFGGSSALPNTGSSMFGGKSSWRNSIDEWQFALLRTDKSMVLQMRT